MKHRYLWLLGSFLSGPVFAQHEGHGVGAPTENQEQQTPDPHAGHTMPPAAATPPENTHEGHDVNAAVPSDPHAGHVMPQVPAPSAHEGHDMTAMDQAATREEQAPPPEAFSGPQHAADLFYNPAEMASARDLLRNEHGSFTSVFFMADQFELREQDGEDTYLWDAQGWYGGDFNKFWFKTEGEGQRGESPEELEFQTLWSRAIHPWFDFQAGVRWDFERGFERSHLVLGLQGLLPYRFEVDAAAFISEGGDITTRFEGEYDVWLTQRLVLQPRIELELSGQDIPEREIGSGLASGEFGLRLHYQIVRELAPYLGLEYEYLFSDTADYARLAGKGSKGWNAVFGVRSWF
jgi:copper resistance protein B